MSICPSFSKPYINRKDVKVDPEFHRKLVIATMDSIWQAQMNGDQVEMRAQMIQLAYLTDSKWYLDKVGETV